MAFNLKRDCDYITDKIKHASWFPYRQGVLQKSATTGELISPTCYRINFNSQVAPYVVYLEEGTSPHNIPKAFGYPLPFGTSGRFEGKFHPGSRIHQGFIKEKCIREIVEYFTKKYNGVLTEVRQ